jgi:DNA-binding protein Fis
MSNSSFNPLQHIHSQLIGLPQTVKKCICEECNWSVPTYYRKIKGGDISNAEKEKIIGILFEQLQRTWERCKKDNNLPPAGMVVPA